MCPPELTGSGGRLYDVPDLQSVSADTAAHFCPSSPLCSLAFALSRIMCRDSAANNATVSATGAAAGFDFSQIVDDARDNQSKRSCSPFHAP